MSSRSATDFRVLHLFANYKWTGPADPAIRSAARLRGLGVDVVFAQAGFVHEGGEHRMSEELWRWRMPVVTGLQLRKHFHLPSLMRDVHELRGLIERDRYDLLHCHLPEAPKAGLRERFAFSRSAGVIAPTAAAREGVTDRLGVPAARVLLQEPATEPRRVDGPDLRKQWGAGPEELLVGITARIQDHRRFDLLWDVAAHVCDQLPQVRFVLLGRGNEVDTRNLVQNPIRELGLEGRVLLPGYLKEPDYSAALRSLDLFLFLVPGSDGTCRAVREAMAFGLPVVATDRGILPELLAPRRDGEQGGRACEESIMALAEALLELLRDPEERERQSQAALRRVRLDMDPETAARAQLALYEAVMEER
jgi:glycosyltransferase involved in cell wall biosynthesis